MKRTNIRVMALLALLWGMVGGCGHTGENSYSPYQHILYEEEAHLIEGDDASPYCDFSMDYTCLDEEDDSIAALVNRTLQREFLGEPFAGLYPQEATDSFRNTYLRDYREEVLPLYQAEVEQAQESEEVPPWYSRTYSLVTFIEEGHSGVLNASADSFVDSGGAHPDQWSLWLNLDAGTGRLLMPEDVFAPSAKADIERILLQHLIHHVAQEYPEEEITTLEHLQAKGFLQLTDIFIPRNFHLAKKAVIFLYNRYDIAPYSEGETVLEVPYEEIGAYLLRN